MSIVRSVMRIPPDENGNVNLPLVNYVGSVEGLKIWSSSVVTNNGNWSIDYSDANFNEIVSIQLTVESPTEVLSERAISANVKEKSLTNASGYVYTISSTGLLVGMAMVLNSQPATIHVTVIGK